MWLELDIRKSITTVTPAFSLQVMPHSRTEYLSLQELSRFSLSVTTVYCSHEEMWWSIIFSISLHMDERFILRGAVPSKHLVFIGKKPHRGV